MELKYYDKASDDIDDIKNKQVRCIGELLQNQFTNWIESFTKKFN